MDWTERIGRRLKPRDLHIFMAVAETGSMAKAAEQLAISRPVVSKTIAELEGVFGVRLLDRSAQGVELTLYGSALFKRGLAVFDELRQSVKEIEFLADPSAGELRIGLSEVPAGGIVPTAVDRLAQHYPKIVVYTQQGANAAVLGHLRERRCEVVLVRHPGTSSDLELEPLYYESLFVVAGKHSKFARRKGLTLHDLAGANWIQSYAEISPGGPTFEAFKAQGLDLPKCSVVSDSLNFRFGLLQTGRFITMIPGSVLHYGLNRTAIAVLPIKPLRWDSPTTIATLKGRTLSPLAGLFVKELKTLAVPLSKRTFQADW